MNASNIINVSEANFEYEVIEYSQETPVLVDFWAEWCIPCKTLEPVLRSLALQGDDSFRLARLNVDENQKLAMRLNVRAIPAVKAFRESHIIAEFNGIKSENEIKKFIQHIIPSYADLILDKGNSLLVLEQWENAASAFREVLSERSKHPGALLGLAKSLLAMNQLDDALDILGNFPTSREYTASEKLIPLAKALQRPEYSGSDELAPLEATYQHALRLIRRGNFPAAMDGILAVLKQERNYRDHEARQVLLGLFEILGDENNITRQYRNELASVLF